MKRLTDREVLILELIFCGLPLVYYLLRLPFMPETVPVHWNASGEADRLAGRFRSTRSSVAPSATSGCCSGSD